MNDNPMYEQYVQVSWCPQDVKSLYPEWSDKKCMEMLDRVSTHLENTSIELGSQALETLLSLQESE